MVRKTCPLPSTWSCCKSESPGLASSDIQPHIVNFTIASDVSLNSVTLSFSVNPSHRSADTGSSGD